MVNTPWWLTPLSKRVIVITPVMSGLTLLPQVAPGFFFDPVGLQFGPIPCRGGFDAEKICDNLSRLGHWDGRVRLSSWILGVEIPLK